MMKSVMAVLSGVSILALGACQKSGSTTNETTNTTTTTTAASSQSGIDGTWRADVTTAKWDQKPDEYLLQNGKYGCKSCTPPLSVPADGAFHKVTGHPYYDETSVKVVDDKTLQQASKLKGRGTGGATMKVSADGKTLGIDWNDKTAPMHRRVPVMTMKLAWRPGQPAPMDFRAVEACKGRKHQSRDPYHHVQGRP